MIEYIVYGRRAGRPVTFRIKTAADIEGAASLAKRINPNVWITRIEERDYQGEEKRREREEMCGHAID